MFCAMDIMDVVEGKSTLTGLQLKMVRESAFGLSFCRRSKRLSIWPTRSTGETAWR